MAWTYSDYVTYTTGTATRLERLRLHIKEVSDAISGGNYSVPGLSISKTDVRAYLSELKKEEAELAQTVGASGSDLAGWSKGQPVGYGFGSLPIEEQ